MSNPISDRMLLDAYRPGSSSGHVNRPHVQALRRVATVALEDYAKALTSNGSATGWDVRTVVNDIRDWISECHSEDSE